MKRLHPSFTLAVSASPRGFAFVLFRGRNDPFDWGVKDISGEHKNARCLAEIKKLMLWYRPQALVFEETGKGSRRGPRIRALYRMVEESAYRQRIPVVRLTKNQIRGVFTPLGAATRPEIAKAIALQIPAFIPRLPRLRKIWMSEDPRQTLFDAAALGMTYYALRPRPDEGEEPQPRP
jgi:hypothetical protein